MVGSGFSKTLKRYVPMLLHSTMGMTLPKNFSTN